VLRLPRGISTTASTSACSGTAPSSPGAVAQVTYQVARTSGRTCGWLPPVPRHDLLLDPFWVGRRGDAFDETCR